MKKISLLHPFTPKAAGVVEKSVSTYHSQPHLKAIEVFVAKTGLECSIEYFTPKCKHYSFTFNKIQYVFYPVDFKWNGDHKKWKKQVSKKCLKIYTANTPDVTIINMSGHSSPFSYELSKIILQNNKQYIAMLGGQHYTDTTRNRDYYRNANHILVHTHLQKMEMEKMEIFKGLDIRVFPLGVDCDYFNPLARKNSSPKLLYVGRIVEWKRIHLAIEAISTLKENGFPEASLKIIGPVSSQEYMHSLKKMVIDQGLQNNVEFLGHKEHAELPKYFQEADLFTLPSDKETFGMVMIEAMACGTPVAGMDCPGGPSDVITHLENGLLTTPEKYSQTILDYFKNQDRIATIEKNARKKVIDEYSIQATYKVLEESINAALSKKM
ncbi:glycosyltransferase family 4 protein [Aequorivita sp. CIP111184]|uniref:glycosyltransferase family 4 protein n=1 Tax=Aequorivita sp. CIP111184 TaxID=2211356 RepID=UPI000DBBF420|nr:glycosyltransferase family 4 protein [Aequorivita sp. CIP111184]SRX55345.1 Glycogen synthase [Aequorivita sp. CIP111184]